MLKFRIPDNVLESLEFFFGLQGDVKDKIIDSLAKSPAGVSPNEISDSIAAGMNIDVKHASGLVNAFANLAAAKESLNANIEDLIDDLSGKLKSAEKKVVSEYILLFFKKCEFFIATIKATSLSFNRDKILLSTKIITDIRPIFSANEELSISAAVIIKTLRVEFREGDEIKEYYFALDGEDLSDLMLQIQRAEKKECLLIEQLEKSKTPVIKVR